MTKPLGQIACLLLIFALAGCTSLFGRPGVPPDPLFANRKPVESKAVTGPPVASPFAEPAPPLNPYAAER